MRKRGVFALLLSGALGIGLLSGAVDKTQGKQELQKSCNSCHGLQVIQAQRLSRSDWERELAKMTKLGAQIKNRPLLLEYLASEYGSKRAN